MANLTPFGFLFTAWGAVTFLLSILLIYRATVSMKEEDLLFLDPAEAALAAEQRQIQNRLNQLRPYVWSLSTMSAILMVGMGAFITWSVLA